MVGLSLGSKIYPAISQKSAWILSRVALITVDFFDKKGSKPMLGLACRSIQQALSTEEPFILVNLNFYRSLSNEPVQPYQQQSIDSISNFPARKYYFNSSIPLRQSPSPPPPPRLPSLATSIMSAPMRNLDDL